MTFPCGINNSGVVSGYYYDAGGCHGFSVSPIATSSCTYDLNGDHDVDGLDLAQFIISGHSADPLKVAALSAEFGSNNCF